MSRRPDRRPGAPARRASGPRGRLPERPEWRRCRGGRGRPGFTVIELLVVLSITAVLTSVAGLSVGRYLGRSTARRAAQLFTQDLSQARRAAVSAREPVAIRFFEDERRYEVVAVQSGTMIVMRRFVDSDGIDLSEATLELDGDSLRFDRRGFADLSGASGPLGTATFGSGTARYTVSFNALGAARIEGA